VSPVTKQILLACGFLALATLVAADPAPVAGGGRTGGSATGSTGGSATGPARGAPSASATPSIPADGRQVRVFEIRYQDVGDVSLMLPSLVSDTAVLTIDRASKTVTVVDRPELVQHVAEFLAQFDVPPHAVVVRIVIEKATRTAPIPGDGLPLAQETAAWKYSPLAETTLEVLERGQATQVIGPDDAFEIHLKLDSVDMKRRVMRFDEVAVRRLEKDPAAPSAEPARHDVFKTSVDLQDRVGKVVMASHDDTANVALVVRMLGLVRDGEKGP
jgi:hypothetical protein